MSSVDEKKIMNELYDALLVTTAAIAVSMASRKSLREPLGTPESIKGTLKLALAIGVGTITVKWAQRNLYSNLYGEYTRSSAG